MLTYHGRKNNNMQLFSARELISDYSYSWCGGAELITDCSNSRGSGTERPIAYDSIRQHMIAYDSIQERTII